MKKEIEQDNIHFNAKSVPCQKRYLKDMETVNYYENIPEQLQVSGKIKWIQYHF